MNPTVSIIIATRDRAANLETCLASCEQLDFDRARLEVVIVDDGSSDTATAEVAARFAARGVRVDVVRNEESVGPGRARNAGVEASCGDVIAFIDDDVVVPPGWLAELIAPLSDRSVGIVGGPDTRHPSWASLFGKCADYTWTSWIGTGGIRSGGRNYHPRSFNMATRREVLRETGGFIGWSFGEDLELSNRIRLAGYRAVYQARAFVYHRRRDGLARLVHQVFARGHTRSKLMRVHRNFIAPAPLAPALLVAGAAGLAGLAPVNPLAGAALLAGALLYLGALLSAGAAAGLKLGEARAALLVPLLLLLQHHAYGVGLLVGLADGGRMSTTEQLERLSRLGRWLAGGLGLARG